MCNEHVAVTNVMDTLITLPHAIRDGRFSMFTHELELNRSFTTQTVVVKDMLYLCGGWNSMKQFDDLFVLDTKTWTWSKVECGSGKGWGPPR